MHVIISKCRLLKILPSMLSLNKDYCGIVKLCCNDNSEIKLQHFSVFMISKARGLCEENDIISSANKEKKNAQ